MTLLTIKYSLGSYISKLNSTGPALLKYGALHWMVSELTKEAVTFTEPNLHSSAWLNGTVFKKFWPVTLTMVPPALGPLIGSILWNIMGPLLLIMWMSDSLVIT